MLHPPPLLPQPPPNAASVCHPPNRMAALLLSLPLLVLGGCAMTDVACEDCPACQQERAARETAHVSSEKPNQIPETAAAETAEPLIVQTSASVSSPADSRIQQLEDQMLRLQQERSDELAHQKRLQLAVYAMDDRVRQLTGEVNHWKGEVARLQHEAVAQHNADLQTMELLETLVDELPAAAGQPGVPPR